MMRSIASVVASQRSVSAISLRCAVTSAAVREVAAVMMISYHPTTVEIGCALVTAAHLAAAVLMFAVAAVDSATGN